MRRTRAARASRTRTPRGCATTCSRAAFSGWTTTGARGRFESFAEEIGKALPPSEYPIQELGPDHAIYRTLFPIAAIPQVPSIQFWRQSGGETSEMGEYSARAHMAAITDKHGRVMVLMTHNTDISDSWEREGEDPQFFYNFSPNGYAVGLNSVLYALTH